MIDTAVRLFQRDGYAATSWRGLVQEAGTPWGSVQHHFPGGKEELGVAAVQAAADLVSRTIAKAFREHDCAADAVTWWFDTAASVLAKGGFRSGCPLATVALERSHASEALTAALETAFRGWLSLVETELRTRGATEQDARMLAMQVLACLEGALIVGRVLGDGAPLTASLALVAPLLSELRRNTSA
jgi:AcrR family transcriptional regulator